MFFFYTIATMLIGVEADQLSLVPVKQNSVTKLMHNSSTLQEGVLGCPFTKAQIIRTTRSAFAESEQLGVDLPSFGSGSLPGYCSNSGSGSTVDWFNNGFEYYINDGRLPKPKGIHCYSNINDGVYGNEHSWIPSKAGDYVGFHLDNPHDLIGGFCVSRDKTGVYKDRARDTLTFRVSLCYHSEDCTSWKGTDVWCTVGSINREGDASELCYYFSPPIQAKRVMVVASSSPNWGDLSCIDELQIFSPIPSHSFPPRDNTVCRRTYEGGCIRWQDLFLRVHSGRIFSVGDCRKLCSGTTECDGFFLSKTRDQCHLYKKGCRKSGDTRWDFYAMDDCKICKRTYEGGCIRWQDLSLRVHSGRIFSVEDCRTLCSGTTECDGFFLTKLGWQCALYKKGCQKSADTRYDFYAMDDCK